MALEWGEGRGGTKGGRETEGGGLPDPTSGAVEELKDHMVLEALPLGPPDVWLYSEYFWLVER